MIIQNFLGWFTFFFVFFIFHQISTKNKKIRNFLISALILRAFFVVLDQYFINLPDSTGDAYSFEIKAHTFSQEYGLTIFSKFLQDDSYFISKFISIFYTLLGRSEMMAKMLSVGFGTGAVFLIYKLTKTIWGERTALKVGWFAAFFPSLILYSSLILREIYVIFFLTYAILNCVKYINKNSLIYFVKIFIGFFAASLFHGPIFTGLIIFLIYLFFDTLKKNNYFLRFKKKKLYSILLLPLFLLPLITYLLGYYSIPKVGSINNFAGNKYFSNSVNKLLLEDKIIWKINKATRSSDNKLGASYPKWTIPNNFIEIIYLTPVRIFYFLYSPFPWDIKKLSHLVGFIDAFFYIYLSVCVFKNINNISRNPTTKFLIIIFLFFVFLYSFGVGNFGTGIRHRLKFISILIAIAAPKIAKIKISNIN